MSIDDLPAIMGTVLIVAGLALVGVSTWSRAEGSEKTTQAGALIIVVGAFHLGLSIFVSPTFPPLSGTTRASKPYGGESTCPTEPRRLICRSACL